MEYRALLLVLCLIIIIVCSIFLLLWPIKIAKKRQLETNIVNIIIVLSILSLFLWGITWLIALIMAYVYPTKAEVEDKRQRETTFIGGKDQEARNIDKLTQLAELHKQGLLTKEEFEAKKKQLLG
ncbi:SHOCT domain-containing protein [Candidatus Proelusimicrobium excrementi]|uniref:SHOCT domain-containing protein n=1 Tax=Candidatus Proelusimicrobium excrementi TaxID=3416222 RepID=UPI003C84E20C|nr:SHOCT domain-containing protein [Elusimicrobiaceae bacterium]